MIHHYSPDRSRRADDDVGDNGEQSPRSWAYHGIDGPIRAITHVTVAPLGDSARSHVTIDVAFEGNGIGKLLVPHVHWLGLKESSTNCRNLKERLEGSD